MFVVSSKSGGTIETTVALRALLGADRRKRRAVRRRHRPGLAARSRRRGRRASAAKFWLADPNIGGRYTRALATSAWCRRRSPAIAARRAAGKRRSPPPRAAKPGRRATPACRSGAKLGELALAGHDKLTFVVDAPFDRLRPLGRAADRREHRQARPRHPAGRRRAARRSRDAYGDDRVFVHIATLQTPTATTRRRSTRCEQPATRSSDIDARARPTISAAHVLLSSSPPRSPAACSTSTPSTSRTCRGQGRDQRGARARRVSAPFDDADGLQRAARRGRGRRTTSRSWATSRRSADVRRSGRRAARARSAPRPASPRPSATARASCTPPASCTRAARPRGVSCSWCTTAPRTSTSPDASYSFETLKHAQAIGDLQALKQHGRPVVRLELAGDPAQAVKSLTTSLD